MIGLNWMTSLFLAILICHPFGYAWLSIDSYPKGGCGNVAAAYFSVSIPNILTDIIILVLPMHASWNLQTQTAQKTGLTITFLSGCMYVRLPLVLGALMTNKVERLGDWDHLLSRVHSTCQTP